MSILYSIVLFKNITDFKDKDVSQKDKKMTFAFVLFKEMSQF